MKRGPIEYIFLIIKGIAMGAADVIPGVSGGTIAFITGIYEELIDSIKSYFHSKCFQHFYSSTIHPICNLYSYS